MKKLKEYRHKKDCVICIKYPKGELPKCYRKSHRRKSIKDHLKNIKTEGACWRCGIGGGTHQSWCISGKLYFSEINFWRDKLNA